MPQYLFTEAEVQAQRAAQETALAAKDEALMSMCRLVANHAPATRRWAPEDATPWGCILDTNRNLHYCDCCPARDCCPHPHKQWSK